MYLGHEWTLLLAEHKSAGALLIGDQEATAILQIAERYEQVVVWCASSEDEGRLRAELKGFTDEVSISAVRPADLIARLSTLPTTFSLVVFSDVRNRYGKSVAYKLADTVEKGLSVGGQLLVRVGIRLGLKNLLRNPLDSFGRPRLRALTGRCEKAGFGHTQHLYPYPENQLSKEYLGFGRIQKTPEESLFGRILNGLGAGRLGFNFVLVLSSRELQTPRVARIAAQGSKGASDVMIQRFIVRSNGIVVALFTSSESDAVLKIALHDAAKQRIHASAEAAQRVSNRSVHLAHLIPRQIDSGRSHGFAYSIETQCQGLPAVQVMKDASSVETVHRTVLNFLVSFGDTGSSSSGSRNGDDLVRRYVSPVIDGFPELESELTKLGEKLTSTLGESRLRSVHAHGDFNPSNVFLSRGGQDITGIIDWDAENENGVPATDLLHFVLASTKRRRSRALGNRVVACLDGVEFSASESSLLSDYMRSFGIRESNLPVLIVLYWLNHICVHLKYKRQSLPVSWVKDNLVDPLDAMLRMSWR
ncbi:MAG: phosphotransferase [Woeseiaceae bacterium]|nr:phosphotransferase [Woeseiaceae bacterium]